MTDPAEHRLGLRERKKQETRTALSLATLRLTIERGWDNVTIEDIAAAANVSVRTFRNYFTGKAEAIAARHLDRMLRIAEELRSRPQTEPLWEAISHTMRHHYAPEAEPSQPEGTQRHHGDAIAVMLTEPAIQGEIHNADMAAQIELAAVIGERTATTGTIYPKLVAAVVCAAGATAVEHCLRAVPPISIAWQLQQVFDQVAAGLPQP